MKDQIEKMVEFLTTKQNVRSISNIKPTGGLKRFTYANPIFDGFVNMDDPAWINLDENSINNLSKPLNFSLITFGADESTSYQVTNTKFFSARDLRGKTKKYFSLNVSLGVLYLNSGNKNQYIEVIYSFDPLKNMWIQNDNRIKESDDRIGGATKININTQFQYMREMEWEIKIKRENSLGLSFATDIEGAKEIFKLRDVPEGKKRRTMIRNWISEHWRKKRGTDDKSIKVIEHLRGATKFNWFGMSVEIIPSLEDQKKLIELKK